MLQGLTYSFLLRAAARHAGLQSQLFANVSRFLTYLQDEKHERKRQNPSARAINWAPLQWDQQEVGAP